VVATTAPMSTTSEATYRAHEPLPRDELLLGTGSRYGSVACCAVRAGETVKASTYPKTWQSDRKKRRYPLGTTGFLPRLVNGRCVSGA
jgi:hypothetical protein